MIDFQLFNEASRQISNLLNLKFKGNVFNQEDISDKYNIKYIAPYKIEDLNDKKFDICVSTTTLEHFTFRFEKLSCKKKSKSKWISFIFN